MIAFSLKQITELSALLGVILEREGDMQVSRLKAMLDAENKVNTAQTAVGNTHRKEKQCFRCGGPAYFKACAGVYRCPACGYLME